MRTLNQQIVWKYCKKVILVITKWKYYILINEAQIELYLWWIETESLSLSLEFAVAYDFLFVRSNVDVNFKSQLPSKKKFVNPENVVIFTIQHCNLQSLCLKLQQSIVIL